MFTLEGHIADLFGGRHHIVAACSEQSGDPVLEPLVKELLPACHDTVVDVPEGVRSATIVGLFPLLIVRWDVALTRDVAADEMCDYIVSQRTHEDGWGYTFATYYVGLRFANEFCTHWSARMHARGRRLWRARVPPKSFWSFDGKQHELIVSVMLGLQPFEGCRPQA